MSHHPVRFVPAALFLLAALMLPFPGHGQPNAAEIVPGNVALEMPRVVPSSLDTQTLETTLCGKPDLNGGAGEVGLTVTNDGSSGPFIVPILDVLFGEEEDTGEVSVSRLQWVGLEPFSTDCGRWSYTVTLDPDAVQPVSSLTLRRASGWQPTAPFVGTLEASTLFRFSGEDGETREVPARLRLGLAGRWTVGKDPVGDSDSNLVLFTEQAAATFLNPYGLDPY